MNKVRTWSISSSFWLVEGLPGMSVALYRYVAAFESVVPLLILCDAHGIIAESLLNLLNVFH
jgi:hypothetical protein